jgi:type II secretory pathway component GspD/PulD (secretin)
MRAAFLFLAFLLGCSSSGSDCVQLAGNGQLAQVDATGRQVQIEAKIVLIDRTSFGDLGLDFPIILPVANDAGGTLGGVSHQGRDVIVAGGTVGGPDLVPYLVPNGFDGFLSVVNPNFQSPFAGDAVKIFPTMPFLGQCVTIAANRTTAIQGFAGGANQALLPAVTPALVGNVCFDFPDPTALANLLAAIQGDARNTVLDMPVTTTFDGQRAVITLQDMTPALGDLTAPFQDAVGAVTTNPFGIFTGVTIDIQPTVNGTAVGLNLRLGTQSLSFFRSVQATVQGQPADVEIPLVAPSTVRSDIVIPDGQTVVIGDFQREGQSATEHGIPVLGEVPVLGALTRTYSNDNQNLMIFITPTIIEPAE